MTDPRYEPVPVPQGDGRYDIGDDRRAAIVQRLIADWSLDPDLTPEKVRQLAMWAGASVRALFHELGTLQDLASPVVSAVPQMKDLEPEFAAVLNRLIDEDDEDALARSDQPSVPAVETHAPTTVAIRDRIIQAAEEAFDRAPIHGECPFKDRDRDHMLFAAAREALLIAKDTLRFAVSPEETDGVLDRMLADLTERPPTSPGA